MLDIGSYKNLNLSFFNFLRPFYYILCQIKLVYYILFRDVHDQIMQSKEMVEEVYNDMR